MMSTPLLLCTGRHRDRARRLWRRRIERTQRSRTLGYIISNLSKTTRQHIVCPNACQLVCLTIPVPFTLSQISSYPKHVLSPFICIVCVYRQQGDALQPALRQELHRSPALIYIYIYVSCYSHGFIWCLRSLLLLANFTCVFFFAWSQRKNTLNKWLKTVVTSMWLIFLSSCLLSARCRRLARPNGGLSTWESF